MRTVHADASPWPSAARPERAPGFAAGAVLTMTLAMYVAPRGDWLYLALVAAVLLALLVSQGWRLADARAPTATVTALAAFGALAIAGELWGAVPGKALASGGAFVAMVGLCAIACDAIVRLNSETVRRAGFGLMVGFLAGLAFLMFETASHFALQRWLYSVLPGLVRATDKHLHLVNDQVAVIDPANIKRHMAQATLLLWPVALLTLAFWRHPRGRMLCGAVVAATLAAGLLARHDSSNLALGASLLAFLAAQWSYRWTWRAVLASWLLFTLFIVPLMLLQFEARYYEQAWIQQSGRHRMVIWGYSAAEVAKAPILGIGAGSGKAVDARRTDVKPVPGQPFEFRTADHQHNFYLQAWYEMGLLGALSFCFAGLVALDRLRRLPDESRSYALATFVAAMFLVSTSYGLWQEWFVASIAIAAVALTLAMRIASPDAFDCPPPKPA